MTVTLFRDFWGNNCNIGPPRGAMRPFHDPLEVGENNGSPDESGNSVVADSPSNPEAFPHGTPF
jgi:hypothetical protein